MTKLVVKVCHEANKVDRDRSQSVPFWKPLLDIFKNVSSKMPIEKPLTESVPPYEANGRKLTGAVDHHPFIQRHSMAFSIQFSCRLNKIAEDMQTNGMFRTINGFASQLDKKAISFGENPPRWSRIL